MIVIPWAPLTLHVTSKQESALVYPMYQAQSVLNAYQTTLVSPPVMGVRHATVVLRHQVVYVMKTQENACVSLVSLEPIVTRVCKAITN